MEGAARALSQASLNVTGRRPTPFQVLSAAPMPPPPTTHRPRLKVPAVIDTPGGRVSLVTTSPPRDHCSHHPNNLFGRLSFSLHSLELSTNRTGEFNLLLARNSPLHNARAWICNSSRRLVSPSSKLHLSRCRSTAFLSDFGSFPLQSKATDRTTLRALITALASTYIYYHNR